MSNFNILIANKIVHKKTYSDSNSAALFYKDANDLQQLNVSDYLANSNICVVVFI